MTEHTNDIEPTTPVTEQASNWWVLLNEGDATAADHRTFAEWVARSPERVEAYLQAACLGRALRSRRMRWPDTPVEEAAEIMLKNGFRHLPVVEGRTVCGVVSLRDLFATRIRRPQPR